MNFGNAFLLAVIALMIVVAVYWLVTHFFSGEAKMERRRRRSTVEMGQLWGGGPPGDESDLLPRLGVGAARILAANSWMTVRREGVINTID